MIMKQLRYIITALAALLALAGCQQPEQDVEARAVATSENLLIFEAQGGRGADRQGLCGRHLGSGYPQRVDPRGPDVGKGDG